METPSPLPISRSFHRKIYHIQPDVPTYSRTSPSRSSQLGRSATTITLQSLTPTISPSVFHFGCSGLRHHRILHRHQHPVCQKNKANHTIPITLPNGDTISSTHIALLPQKNLTDASRRAHIFLYIKKPLISIGTLCDNNCITVFETNYVTIYDKDTHQPVITGQRYPVTTLYVINMTATPTLMTEPTFPDSFFANNIYETKTKHELIMFYYAACFSTSKITFIKVIKHNDFTPWPVLTAEFVAKYLPKNRDYCQRPHNCFQGNQLHTT